MKRNKRILKGSLQVVAIAALLSAPIQALATSDLLYANSLNTNTSFSTGEIDTSACSAVRINVSTEGTAAGAFMVSDTGFPANTTVPYYSQILTRSCVGSDCFGAYFGSYVDLVPPRSLSISVIQPDGSTAALQVWCKQ